MWLKAVLVVASLALLGFAATIFEAASVTARAFQDIAAAEINTAEPVQAQLLRRAENAILLSWARPTAWHAGATEALSAAYFIDGQTHNDARALHLSAFWAGRAVELSPVQPHAWTRLALLAELGHANRL